MKFPAVLLAYFLALSLAPAADFFGKPTGPSAPAASPTPAASSTPAPTGSASPTPAPPEPRATPPPPATALASPATLAALRSLGPLQSDLRAWFSFNGRDIGGLTWSAQPVAAMLNEQVGLRDEGGKTVADFAEPGAALDLKPAFPLGPKYTLAAWVSFPMPGKDSMLFMGAHNNLLYVASGRFQSYMGKMTVHAQKFGDTPAPTTGWHHVALCGNATQSTLYVDGHLQGTLDFVIDEAVAAIGNHSQKGGYQNHMMAAAMDDVLIFGRDLTADEIARVMPLRLPGLSPAALATIAKSVPLPPKVKKPASSEPSAPLAPAAPPSPSATASSATDPVPNSLVKTYRNSLVFVTGAEGSGSGFIATAGGANFLITNAHVAAGIKSAAFKTLDGTAVQVGAPAIAEGHDVFRLQLGPGGQPLELMQGVDENATIGDEVVVLGNAEGAGVINTIKGKIVGLGPDRLEIDAPFQPGNSGSPIIHLKTGKVIGVATYLTIKKYDSATKEILKTPVVRRFGYRIDSVKTWQPVNWPLFFAQSAELQKIETLTDDLDNFLVDLANHKGHVTPGAHKNPAISTRIDQWLAEKKRHLNASDAAGVDQNFLSFLKVACRSDLTVAQPHMTYDYFQRQLVDEQQARSEIAEIFDKIIKQLQADQ